MDFEVTVRWMVESCGKVESRGGLYLLAVIGVWPWLQDKGNVYTNCLLFNV